MKSKEVNRVQADPLRLNSAVRSKGAFLWGDLYEDHSKYGTSKEPMNPLWPRIHQPLWCTMWVIHSLAPAAVDEKNKIYACWASLLWDCVPSRYSVDRWLLYVNQLKRSTYHIKCYYYASVMLRLPVTFTLAVIVLCMVPKHTDLQSRFSCAYLHF